MFMKNEYRYPTRGGKGETSSKYRVMENMICALSNFIICEGSRDVKISGEARNFAHPYRYILDEQI